MHRRLKITLCSALCFIDLTPMIFTHVICPGISQSVFSLQKSIYIVFSLFSATMWWALFQVTFISLASVLRIKRISIPVECGQVKYITIETVTLPIYFFPRIRWENPLLHSLSNSWWCQIIVIQDGWCKMNLLVLISVKSSLFSRNIS